MSMTVYFGDWSMILMFYFAEDISDDRIICFISVYTDKVKVDRSPLDHICKHVQLLVEHVSVYQFYLVQS